MVKAVSLKSIDTIYECKEELSRTSARLVSLVHMVQPGTCSIAFMRGDTSIAGTKNFYSRYRSIFSPPNFKDIERSLPFTPYLNRSFMNSLIFDAYGVNWISLSCSVMRVIDFPNVFISLCVLVVLLVSFKSIILYGVMRSVMRLLNRTQVRAIFANVMPLRWICKTKQAKKQKIQRK